jgi:hypothetical protein
MDGNERCRGTMKTFGRIALCLVGAAFLSGGCSKQKDAKSELERAAATMAQPEPVQPAPTAEPVAQQPTAPPTPAPAPVNSSQEMSKAMAAYKAGDLDDAVTRLQNLRATPVMSPEKRMALNDAMAAVMTEIYSMAAKGDTRAIQAVKTYETLQTRPR